jgi:hypothetical protein
MIELYKIPPAHFLPFAMVGLVVIGFIEVGLEIASFPPNTIDLLLTHVYTQHDCLVILAGGLSIAGVLLVGYMGHLLLKLQNTED